MGFAVAEAARAAGAEVVAVVGRVNLPPPEGVLTIRAETAARMREVAAIEAATADIFVAAAAVADFRPARVARQKIRRQSDFSLRLRPTEDILAAIAASAEAPFCVGFAAETGDWEIDSRIGARKDAAQKNPNDCRQFRRRRGQRRMRNWRSWMRPAWIGCRDRRKPPPPASCSKKSPPRLPLGESFHMKQSPETPETLENNKRWRKSFFA